jgi:dTMP kinase
MTTSPGLFIVLDGPDGAGKTTQAAALEAHLREAHGRETLAVREPGGTKLGEDVRRILLDPAHEAMILEAELLLYMASRAQLVKTVIAPALEGGKAVVADRYVTASLAYQGVAGGLGTEPVRSIGAFATGDLAPDLILVLDVPPETGLARGGEERDRIEARDLSYHEKVREGFLGLDRIYPGRVTVIDATRPPAEVTRDVIAAVDKLIESRDT